MVQTGSIGDRVPLPVGDLASTAWRSLIESLRGLWPVVLIWAALAGGNAYLLRLVQPQRATETAGLLLVTLLSAFTLAVPSGMATRMLLGSDKPWWKLDRGFAAYVLVYALGLAAIQLAFSAAPLLQLLGASLDAGALALVAILQLVGGCVVSWVVLRLTLWPIALLMGEKRLSAGHAWRQMRGAVWPYLAAGFIAAIIPGAVLIVFALLYRSGGADWALAPEALISALTGLLFVAVAAEIYRRRSAFGVGDVFD